MPDQTKTDVVGFEAAVRQLEQTVEDLESGELGLDGALAKYQQGVRLLAHCYHLLDGAERTVALLKGVDADGQPVTMPFDGTATAERDTAAEPRPEHRVRSAQPTTQLSPAGDETDLPF
jgi:exodeoxyribonuclease VII small subunit